MFETHQILENIVGNATWLTEFKRVDQEYLNFIELLLQILYLLCTCRAISETYPAYIAEIFSSYFALTLSVAKTKSTILDALLRITQIFTIGKF